MARGALAGWASRGKSLGSIVMNTDHANSNPAPPAAVLWDMDGTLIDTEPYWMAAERALVTGAGGTWTQDQAEALIGNALIDSAEIILSTTPVTGTPEQIVDRLLTQVIADARRRLPWRPGARELLAELSAAGMPCALVTMSWKPLADVLVETLPAGTFAEVVTGDRVARGKPHPEPYLLAADRLGLAPEACLAIEDSDTGVRSAVAAGVPTLGVRNLVELPDLPGLYLRDTLEGICLADLGALRERALLTRAS